MIAMCERCCGLTEGFALTGVEGMTGNPADVSLVLLCKKCKSEEELVSNTKKKCIFSCAAKPVLNIKLKI